MSTKTKTFFVGGGIVVVGILLAVYFLPWEEEARSPCTNNYDPDTIINILDPVTLTAATEAGENNTLCVFCIVPCDPDAPQGSCDEENAFSANYSISETSGNLTISITPTAEPAESNQTTGSATIVETKKLPEAWQDEAIYDDHHLLIFQVIHSGGGDQQYNVVLQDVSPGFNVVLTVPAI